MRCSHYGCQSEAESGKKQCRPHLDRARTYQAERRKKLLAEGKCSFCTEQSRPGKTMCQKCADRWNEYLRTRRSKA